jgi:hypothetical protein
VRVHSDDGEAMVTVNVADQTKLENSMAYVVGLTF